MKTLAQRFLGVSGILFMAIAASAQNYAIDWFTIDGGGGTSTGGGYSMSGSIGDPGAGNMSGGGYTLEGGFWSIDAAVAALFDTNLILNPGGEAGLGSVSGNDVFPVPNWTTADNFTVSVYEATLPSPGPAFGTNLFAGGHDTPLSTAVQTIDVSALAAEIDSAMVSAELSGYFGGFMEQDDRASLTATYLGATSNALGNLSVGNVLAVDRTNRTALVYRATSNAVPVGTRKIEVLLRMTRDAGNYNDGYADNLSLVLRIPPPAPELRIFSTATNTLVFAWPAPSTGFTLQQQTNLTTANWLTVTDTVNVVGSENQVILSPPAGNRFYRLIFP